MSAARTMLRKLAETPLGERLRAALNVKPPVVVRPWSAEAAVSDMFPWRVDATWETRFDLTNVPSLVAPDLAPHDEATLVVFAADGSEIARQQFHLEPFEVKSLLIEDYLGGRVGAGTFSVFHSCRGVPELAQTGRHLAERGYVAFRRRGDALWGVVHGNLHALSKNPGGQSLGFVHGRRPQPEPYRLQLRMDDCQRFELTFTNPSPKALPMRVRFLGENRTCLDEQVQTIAARGIGLYGWDNGKAPCVYVEAEGALAMWRPAIFKHYQTHFNVLHS